MKINFSKYNGAGNDFIVIDDRNNNIEINSSLIKKLCNRNFGIGGDGLILIKESKSTDFEIFHYTSDGNLGSLCGNGSRCAISFAFKNNIIGKKTVFEAFDGLHEAEVINKDLIKMEMKINSQILQNKYGTWLDTGSPHLVIEKENTDNLDVNLEGSSIRYNEDYKKEFRSYLESGIDEILINTLTDPKLLKRLTILAKNEGLKVHAWIMAMNRPDDTIALKNPEWYAVSKEGKSCFDTRPYVDYYQWLCPNREESRNHILGLVEGFG